MATNRHPIELIGAQTGNCLRVAIALEEAGLPYQVRLLDLRQGNQRDPAHLALNPAGKVPTIIDRLGEKDLILSQSNAILLYAAEVMPGRLLPLDGRDRAAALERYFYFLTDVIAVSHSAFFLRSLGNHEASAVLDERSNGALRDAARFVKDTRYMGGNSFSLADIAAFTIASARRRHIDWNADAHLSRWFDEVEQRPSVRKGMKAFKRGDG
ncbi:glutathione S-transferase family protein [Gluconobacter cerinus]